MLLISIKISEKLVSSSKFNPTKQSQIKSIFDMCSDIEEGSITLPLYQRDLSWNIDKSISLFNYQLFGKAPVAPISMNQIGDNDTIPQISFITRERIDDNVEGNLSIVDGQQRLVTNYKAYINDPTFKRIVLDVTKPIFKKIKGQPKQNQIPVGILLNKDQGKLREYLNDVGTLAELYPILLEVRSKLVGYNYTVHIAKHLNEDEQIEWFDVLNTAGSKVTKLQLSFSKLKLHEFDIYKDYVNPFKSLLEDYGFDQLLTPFTTKVSYPIVSLNPAYEVTFNGSKNNLNYAPIPSDSKEDLLIKLEKNDLDHLVEITLEGLDKALSLIYENDISNCIDRMDYVLYLTGYFVFNGGELSDDTKYKLVNWVKNVEFSDKTNTDRREIYKKLLEIGS